MRKEKDIYRIPREKLKLPYCLTMILLLLASAGLEYYFHYLRGTTIVYTHLFYIPVIAAAWWWGLMGGFYVSLFLATMHIAFELPDINVDILARSIVFLFVGLTAGTVSDLRKRAEKSLRLTLKGLEKKVEQHTADLVKTNKKLQTKITEHKRAKDTLQESEDRFRQVVGNAQEWVWEVDADGLYTYASPILERVLGYKPEEIVGRKHFYDLIHPDDREYLKNEAFALFVRKESFREFINRNVHKNGETVWLLTSGVPMLDEQGDLLGYRGVDSNITERRQAEKLIQTQRDLGMSLCTTSSLDEGLRLCVEATINISEMDSGGVYLVDEATGALDLVFHKGLTPDFISGTSHYDAESGQTRLVMAGKPVYHQHKQLFEGQGGGYIQEGLRGIAILPVLHDDRVIGCLNVASHIHKEVPYSSRLMLEAIAGQIGSVITRLKLEETLRAYQKELRSLASELSLSEEHERRRIAEDLHDSIGQTLAFTHIKLDLMKEAAEKAGLIKPLREIEKLLGQTIKDADLLISELSPPVLHELGLVAAVEWQAEQIEQQHNLKCIFSENSRSKLNLHSDYRIVLFRAVRELLINVVKHAQASYAKIDIGKDDQFVRITVEDDGIGFNAKKNDTHVGSGGYGLFNIQERLEHFGGSMKVESDKNHGTRIVLTLPLGESNK